jgi:hypothetical protein
MTFLVPIKVSNQTCAIKIKLFFFHTNPCSQDRVAQIYF